MAKPKIPIGAGGEDGTSIDIPQVLANEVTLNTIMNTVYFWAGLVAVLVIVIAGFFYVTSNGDPDKIKRAKNAIIGGITGLVVIILAFTITQFVIMVVQ